MAKKDYYEYKDDGMKLYGGMADSHYSVPSMYGKMVREQYNMQPDYCEPGAADGEMRGEHSNPQKGP